MGGIEAMIFIYHMKLQVNEMLQNSKVRTFSSFPLFHREYMHLYMSLSVEINAKSHFSPVSLSDTDCIHVLCALNVRHRRGTPNADGNAECAGCIAIRT